MDEISAAKFRKRAILSAAGNGFAEHAEDLAHDVLVSWLEGGGQHQTVDQAVIDAIRGAFGRPGTPGYKRRRAVTRPTERLDVVAHHPSKEIHRDSVHDFERLVEPLQSVERAIVCLTYAWGFKEIEIAELFGVTESRISQRLSAALSQVAQRQRKREKQETVSREIQERSRNGGEAQEGLETMGIEERAGISPQEIEKIQEELLGSFDDSAF